jgi:hypothetical protein
MRNVNPKDVQLGKEVNFRGAAEQMKRPLERKREVTFYMQCKYYYSLKDRISIKKKIEFINEKAKVNSQGSGR